MTGVNLVVNTLWPHRRFLQWHTLHHTVLADVYNLNIPSPFDKEHSKWVSKLQQRLETISPFVRYEALSDGFAFGLVLILGVLLHYGLGIGMFLVDWSKHTSIVHG